MSPSFSQACNRGLVPPWPRVPETPVFWVVMGRESEPKEEVSWRKLSWTDATSLVHSVYSQNVWHSTKRLIFHWCWFIYSGNKSLLCIEMGQDSVVDRVSVTTCDFVLCCVVFVPFLCLKYGSSLRSSGPKSKTWVSNCRHGWTCSAKE